MRKLSRKAFWNFLFWFLAHLARRDIVSYRHTNASGVRHPATLENKYSNIFFYKAPIYSSQFLLGAWPDSRVSELVNWVSSIIQDDSKMTRAEYVQKHTKTNRNGYAGIRAVHGITETVLDAKTMTGCIFQAQTQLSSVLCVARLLRKFYTNIYTKWFNLTRLANNKYLNLLFSMTPRFFIIFVSV